MNKITEYDATEFLKTIVTGDYVRNSDVVIAAFILSQADLTSPNKNDVISRLREGDDDPIAINALMALLLILSFEGENLEWGIRSRIICQKSVSSAADYIKAVERCDGIKEIINALKIDASEGFSQFCIGLLFEYFDGCTIDDVDAFITSTSPGTDLDMLVKGLALGSRWYFKTLDGQETQSISVGNDQSSEYRYSYTFSSDLSVLDNSLGISETELMEVVDNELMHFAPTLPNGVANALDRKYLSYLYIYFNTRFKDTKSTTPKAEDVHASRPAGEKIEKLDMNDLNAIAAYTGLVTIMDYIRDVYKIVAKGPKELSKLVTDYAKCIAAVCIAHNVLRKNVNTPAEGLELCNYTSRLRDDDSKILLSQYSEDEINRAVNVEITLFYKSKKVMYDSFSEMGRLAYYVYSLIEALRKGGKL